MESISELLEELGDQPLKDSRFEEQEPNPEFSEREPSAPEKP